MLTENHDREIGAGSTLWGIHKDDVIIDLNSHPARAFASQGQQRSICIALKLAEGEICREEFGDHPVFLFDDVLSELDEKRRDYLINRISGKQVILTCCDKNDVKNARQITVSGGTYKLQD
jgi:DNA replication and repair protein RecF